MTKANEQPTELTIWNDPKKLEEIKGLVAQNLTNTEFQLLVNIGRATDLNPFLREIYAVKYGNGPASIFIGKNGYIKIANSHPNYDGHETEYIRDAKGAVIGCKATVYHKKRAHPVAVEVYLEEYGSGSNPLWKSKKLTMIRKVALVQALRESFPEAFQGVFDESEEWNREPTPSSSSPAPAAPKAPAAPAPAGGRLAKPDTRPTVKQLTDIEELMRELNIPDEAKQKTRKMLHTAADAEKILSRLYEKLKEHIEGTGEDAAPEPSTEPEAAPEAPATVEDAQEVFKGKEEARKLMEEVKALLVPSVDKAPAVQLEEVFAQYCGKDVKPDKATLTQWQLVKKMLLSKRKEQEAAVEAAA